MVTKNHLTDRFPRIRPERLLPVDIVLSPSWWFTNCGITFDEDFFYHPVRRVEAEQHMEQALFERWGKFGIGQHHLEERPEIGAVHLAAGFIISEMLGCQVEYRENQPPQVIPAEHENWHIDLENAFRSPAFQKLQRLSDNLYRKYHYLSGDVNWGGILNIALDLRGQSIFLDMIENPQQVKRYFQDIGTVIFKFVNWVQDRTGSSSVSVNRNVIHLEPPLFLHSECSHTMISATHYEEFLFQFDADWSRSQEAFGIHYCGTDPHRYAQSFAKLPRLDLLDVGWGGHIELLRENLPDTFLNLRLSPVEIIHQTPEEIGLTIEKLVKASGDPELTGVCCINVDDQVKDEQISAIFEAVERLRYGYQNNSLYGKPGVPR